MKTLLVLIVGGLCAGAAQADEHGNGRFWYVIDNITSIEEDARILVWVTLPPEWHGQKVSVSDITPEPVVILEDRDTGNRIIEWLVEPEAWDQDPAGDPAQLYFHYDIELEEIPLVAPDPDGIPGDYATADPRYHRYTQAETWIQTDGHVAARAREIVGAESAALAKGRLIYDWMVANMEFVPGAVVERDAQSVLAAMRGDCGQFSILYTALCRSVGIPARTVSNSWTRGGRHVFAEVLLPTGDWMAVDVALGQMLVPGYDGLSPKELKSFKVRRDITGTDAGWFYGNFADNRVILSVDNNIRFHSHTLNNQVFLQSMTPGGSMAIPEGYRIDGLNRTVIHGGFFVFGEGARDQDLAHEMAHQHLGDLFFQVEVDTPAPTCNQGMDFQDDGIQSWLNTGKAYMHKGEYYKAESAFKRAQQQVDGHKREKLGVLAWIHNYLGNCYDMLDQRDMAVREYQAVMDLNTNFRGARDYAERYLEKPFVHRIN